MVVFCNPLGVAENTTGSRKNKYTIGLQKTPSGCRKHNRVAENTIGLQKNTTAQVGCRQTPYGCPKTPFPDVSASSCDTSNTTSTADTTNVAWPRHAKTHQTVSFNTAPPAPQPRIDWILKFALQKGRLIYRNCSEKKAAVVTHAI